MQDEQADQFGVQLTPRFKRAYKRKTLDQQRAVDNTIVQLSIDPSYPSLRVKKVRGAVRDIWEASVDMARRMTFEYSADHTNIILRNCNGHEVLRQT